MVKRYLEITFLVSVVVLYIAVRLWYLTDSCLWFDEIFSIQAAQNNWDVFFNFIAQDLIHPPLFYLILKAWLFIFGQSLLAARCFPVLFSVLSIFPFVKLCREMKLSRLEILGGILLLAINGSLIKYSQEVRMYSLLLFLSLCSLWLYMRWLNSEKTISSPFFSFLKSSNFIFLLFINLLLIYTHYFGWLIVFAELAAAFWLREKPTEVLLQFVILFFAFTPWLIVIICARQNIEGLEQNLNGNSVPDLQQIWEFISSLHQPFYFPQSTADTSLLFVSVPISLICIGLITYRFIKVYKERNSHILAILFLIPVLISLAVSWIMPVSIWGIRHLTIVFPVYFIILVISFRLIPNVVKTIVLCLFLILLLISGQMTFLNQKPIYIWCAWETLAPRVVESETEKPIVFAFEDLVAYHLWFACNNKFQVIKINGYADMPEDKAYFLPRGFDAVKVEEKDSINGDYFWLAFRQNSPLPNKQILTDLQNKGYEIGVPFRFEAQGATAFMIPVRKNQSNRPAP